MTFAINGTSGLTYPDSTTAATGGNVTLTGAYTISTGTTAQRPATPATGMMRFNTTTSKLEYYNGSAWKATDASY